MSAKYDSMPHLAAKLVQLEKKTKIKFK